MNGGSDDGSNIDPKIHVFKSISILYFVYFLQITNTKILFFFCCINFSYFTWIYFAQNSYYYIIIYNLQSYEQFCNLINTGGHVYSILIGGVSGVKTKTKIKKKKGKGDDD